MKRFENCIRVITAFFAVLLGFGLKHLLDGLKEPVAGLKDNVVPCFVLSALLFLRFLTGSANHLWYEYVRRDQNASSPPKPSKLRRMIKGMICDFVFLLVFGSFGMAICYADKVGSFLIWNFFLCLAGFVWGIPGLVARIRTGKWARWDYWLWINFFQGLFVFLVWFFQSEWNWYAENLEELCERVEERWRVAGPQWEWYMAVLAGGYLLIFLCDLYGQLRNLADGNRAPAMKPRPRETPAVGPQPFAALNTKPKPPETPAVKPQPVTTPLPQPKPVETPLENPNAPVPPASQRHVNEDDRSI